MRVNFRDANSSAATDLEEIQANAFAAAVLMPRDSLIAAARPALQKAQPGGDAAVVRDLSDGFAVSEQAMEYRLINLGLRRQI